MPKSKINHKLLEKAFFEIKQGFSSFEYEESLVYVKHTSLEQTRENNEEYERYFKRATERGLMTEGELLDFLDENGSWTKEEERFSREKLDEIDALKNTKQNLIIQKQQEDIQKKIDELELSIASNQKKRKSLIQNTSEEYATRKVNEAHVFYTIYKDKNLTIPYFSQEESDELSRMSLMQLFELYNDTVKIFKNENIQQLSIEPFFTAYFNLLDTNIHCLFSENILDLTFYQINVLTYAKMFRNIYKNFDDIPKDKEGDAAAILEHVKEVSGKREKFKNKASSMRESSEGGYTYVGATKDDLRKAGVNVENTMDIHSAVNKHGKKGEMDLEDFMKMHQK